MGSDEVIGAKETIRRSNASIPDAQSKLAQRERALLMAERVNQISELIANLLSEASDHARRIINAKAQVQRYEAGVPTDIAEQKLAEYIALIKSNIARILRILLSSKSKSLS